jgi:hypothetical protein
VDGLSFRPSDNTLWGWAQDEGLLTIDKSTGKATLIIDYNGEIEDLTWDNEGKILYAIENLHGTSAFDSEPDKNGAILWAYDGNNAREVCRKMVKDLPEIEALEALANNDLLFGFHQSKKLLIYKINPTTCEITQQGEIDIKYSDIEGISLVPAEKSYAAEMEALEKLREEAAKTPLPPQPPLDRSNNGIEYEYEPVEDLPISQYFTPEDPIAAAVDYVKTYLFTQKERDYYTVDSFDLRSSAISGGGLYIIKLDQKYQDIPVYGVELHVRMDALGKLKYIGGSIIPVRIDESLFPKINTAPNPFIQHSAHPEDQPEPDIYINAQLLDLDMNILIEAEKAKQLVKENRSQFHGVAINNVIVIEVPELMIFNQGLFDYGYYKSILVWRIATGSGAIFEDVLIDVQTGEIVHSMSIMSYALSRSIYDNNNVRPTDLTTDVLSSLRNYGLPGISIVRGEDDPAVPAIKTKIEGSETTTNDVNLAYDFLEDAYKFYSEIHGRDSVDDNGMTLVATVRHCYNEPKPCPAINSSWFDRHRQFLFANGGITDDIVGHELTHAVTDYTSKLWSQWQSGAIDESLSDVWGEFIDLANSTLSYLM